MHNVFSRRSSALLVTCAHLVRLYTSPVHGLTSYSIGLLREPYWKQWKTSRQLSHQRPAFVREYALTSCEALCLLKGVADISEDLKKDSKGAVKAVVEALGVAATVTQSVPYLSAISGVLAELLKIQGVRR